ncbi:hypothetical protein Pfo_023269 [Paulownia fortunei]|nr:hypothetical protein Pfo_023269 [Paulownia fortunei]
MVRFLLLYVMLGVLLISLGRGSESRILESIPPTGMAPANAESSISSPAPSLGGVGTYGTPGLTHIWNHHSADKSVAGGDVILGGFATALVAAIVCYIRITRRSKDSQTSDNIM